MKQYIGIDFSINSPAICIVNDIDEFKFISLTNNSLTRFNKKKIPKGIQIHKYLWDNKIVDVIPYERHKKHEDYSVDQLQKLNDALMLANLVIDVISQNVDIKKDIIHIAIEGYSYGSKGNSFIDLISFNSILRNKINENFILNSKDNIFDIYSPSHVKMYAGKGNAGKPQMYEFFMKKKDAISKNSFYQYCKDEAYKEDIPKPIDDLVDAYFISYLLKDTYS
jgi:hypothetical protein